MFWNETPKSNKETLCYRKQAMEQLRMMRISIAYRQRRSVQHSW